MRVGPWFGRFLKIMPPITRCPLYSMSAIDRFDCVMSREQRALHISSFIKSSISYSSLLGKSFWLLRSWSSARKNTLLRDFRQIPFLKLSEFWGELINFYFPWFSCYFWGNRISLIRLNTLNIRSKIWQRSLRLWNKTNLFI